MFLGLEIGCGESKSHEFIGLDVRPTSSTDVIADASYLPFKDKTFDHVYSSHVLEHFSHRRVKNILTEWVRVLKSCAKLEIRCPDLRARSILFFLNPSWDNVKNIYGAQDYSENYHNCGFSYGLLKGLLEEQGIRKIRRIIKGYKGIPFLPDSLHIVGIKK